MKATVGQWEDYWKSDVSSMVYGPSDLPAIRRLFDYRDEHARAMKAYRKERETPGSRGQRSLSPAFSAMIKLEKLIVPLEDRYGLSAIARLRLGAELGGAHKSLADMNASINVEAQKDDDDTGEVIDLPGLPNAG